MTFLSPWMSAPFFLLVLALFFLPSLWERWWERWSSVGLVTVTALFLGLLGYAQGATPVAQRVLTAFGEEYAPFLLIFTLMYILTSMMTIRIEATPTPLFQTCFLLVGTCMSSVVGTLGASLILLKPLLYLSHKRAHSLHTLVMFIFLVCNIGGTLSPLGDPPLFLGFLKGVPFFWPLQNLSLSVLMMVVPLLLGYVCLDTFLYRREKKDPSLYRFEQVLPQFHFQGVPAFMGVIMLIASMILLETLSPWIKNCLWGGALGLLLLYRGWCALPPISWGPLTENLITFGSLFLFSLPIMDQLSVGNFAETLHGIRGPSEAAWTFWGSGLLSAILDNGPTYLLCVEAFGGIPRLLHHHHTTLVAISTGCVFMGALTYIGNAPNLLVRSLATKEGFPMPTSLAYMGYACLCLFPGFLAITFLLLAG